MSIRIKPVIWIASIFLLLGMFAGGSSVVASQTLEDGINFRGWICRDGDPGVSGEPWDDCGATWGNTYRIEADGVEIADSPVTTERDAGIGHGAFFSVPEGTSTITVTLTSSGPEGYVPAAGYDPLIINTDDLAVVGCGGESTCYGVSFILIPVTDEGGSDSVDTTEDTDITQDGTTTGAVDTLPTTGTGVMQNHASGAQALIGLIVLSSIVLIGAAIVTRRTTFNE